MNAVRVSGFSYPREWSLTPVQRKRPYRPNWQSEPPLDRDSIEQELKSGRATGVGLRLGEDSGGLVAVDLDGISASQFLKVNGLELPPTVSWTSGKPGRSQHLYSIPEEKRSQLQNRKVIETGVIGEQVELRWNNHQSVLPPSIHPDTGKPYQWINAPDLSDVAMAPTWVIKQLTPPITQAKERKVIDFPIQDTSWGDIDRARSYLASLKPERADNRDTWLKVGMALKDVSDDLLPDWDNWSAQSPKYKSGECDRKWTGFKREGVAIGTLGKLAKEDGWVSPKSPRSNTRRHNTRSTATDTTGIDMSSEQKKPRPASSFDEEYTPETQAALEQLNKRFAVIRHNPQAVWDIAGQKPIPIGHLHLILKNRKGQYLQHGDDGPRVVSKSLAYLWETWSERREHDEVDLLPEQATTPKTLNLWQGWGGSLLTEVVKATLWTLHLDVMFGLKNWDGSPTSISEEQRATLQGDRDYFERWLAYPIQNPGAKLRTMALLWSSVQGVGKTTITELMQGLYGQHFLEVESQFFESNFNGSLVGKLFISAEEVFCDGRFGFMNRLKSLITSPRVNINVKHGAQFESVNRFNLLATSNHSNALHLDDQDRRVFVHEITAQNPPDGYFKRLYQWGHSQAGKDSLFSHLKTLDLADFDHYAHARVTESKLRMIDNSRSDLDRWIAELDFSDLPDLVELNHLLQKAREVCPTTRIQGNTLSAAFNKAGFEIRRLSKTYKQIRLVAIREREKWRMAEGTDWGRFWNGEVTKEKINSFQNHRNIGVVDKVQQLEPCLGQGLSPTPMVKPDRSNPSGHSPEIENKDPALLRYSDTPMPKKSLENIFPDPRGLI